MKAAGAYHASAASKPKRIAITLTFRGSWLRRCGMMNAVNTMMVCIRMQWAGMKHHSRKIVTRYTKECLLKNPS